MFTEKFIIAENPPSMPGPGLVIGLRSPFWIGKVVQFKTDKELANFAKTHSQNMYFYCKGYRIVVLVIGKLADPVEQYQYQAGPLMADYFLHNKILKNESYYKRYKQ